MKKFTHQVLESSEIAKQDKDVRDAIYEACKASREAFYVKPYQADYPGWHIVDSKDGKALIATIDKLMKPVEPETPINELNVAELFGRFTALSGKRNKTAAEKKELDAINKALSNS
jgi:hypothetical protein